MNSKLIKTSYLTAVFSLVFVLVQVGLFYLYSLTIVNGNSFNTYMINAAEKFLQNPRIFIGTFLLLGVFFIIPTGLLVNFIIYHLTKASKSVGIYIAGILLSGAIFLTIQIIPLIYLLTTKEITHLHWGRFSLFGISIFSIAFAIFSVKLNRKHMGLETAD